jgi:hypothetical protein
MIYNSAEYDQYGQYRGWQLYYTKNWKVNRYLAIGPKGEKISKGSLLEIHEAIDNKVQEIF